MEEFSCFFLEKIVYVCSGKVIIHERRRMGTTGIVHTLGFHPIPKKRKKRTIEKRNDISPTSLPKYFLRQTMRTGRHPLKQWKGISIQNAGRKEYLLITFLS